MKSSKMLILMIWFIACNHQADAPDIEEAETLTGKYYSSRNREFSYPYYKGLGLTIMDIQRIKKTDTFSILARVEGRKWLNPQKDTMTVPFSEFRTIRVYPNGNSWTGDSLITQ